MRVAIIPARGGSKRIPKKNIRLFAGKPIIAHSILTAKKSGLFDRIIVSTDDREIAETANKFGAETPFLRPPELSDDFTGTHEVISHAVTWLLNTGMDVQEVCCIYATAPFIQQQDLANGLELLNREQWESVFAATRFTYPIFRSFTIQDGGGVKMFFPEHFNSRSQDLPEAVHDAGQFYWAHAKAWTQPSKGFNDRTTVVLLPSWRVLDIDTVDDWHHAELIFKVLEQE